MNRHRLDDLNRSLTSQPSRRHLIVRLVGGIFGWSAARLPPLASARKKRKKRKQKQKQKVAFNGFGCVNVGNVCKNHDQCCSGICEGKQGKKRCQAHDASTCTVNDDVCTGPLAPCTTSAGVPGQCVRTTGNGSFCNGGAICSPCQKDADCQPLFGPQAACFLCDGDCHSGGTLCGGPRLPG